jgi:thiol peroxidase|nr:thiol peroxidase [uncultured Flavobacterium sp.]
MATVTLGGNPTHTSGDLPTIGSQAPAFSLIDTNLTPVQLADFAGQNVILNIFPSIDTPTCATSVRKFNTLASQLPNTKVVCVSRDLPFAQKRFCGSEGLENVSNLSDFQEASFGKAYGVLLTDGKLAGLHARAIVVINGAGEVVHTELVAEIANEPNYDAALQSL